MARLARMLILGGLTALVAGEAAAQYVPPYGYVPPPPPVYAPPAPEYYAPSPLPPPRQFGFRCVARAFTPNGPQRVVCPIERPRPLGRPCTCAPPPPPPGYSPGPYLEGRVIP